jgi:hypothetical protein
VSPQGVGVFTGAGGVAGILNFVSSTGAFTLTSVNVRVELGLPASVVAERPVKGNFNPSTSR